MTDSEVKIVTVNILDDKPFIAAFIKCDLNLLHSFLSNKIQYFIENKESIIQMGKESYKKFNSKFELKKMIDSYNSLFKF